MSDTQNRGSETFGLNSAPRDSELCAASVRRHRTIEQEVDSRGL